MSLRGRRIIDALKQRIGRYYALPVPPYGSLNYWEKVYKQLPPDSVFEWGQLSANDLDPHTYQVIQRGATAVDGEPTVTTTLGAALNVRPKDPDSSTVVLGCGNSAVGEDLVRVHGWQGKLLQVDFVTKIVEEMNAKCHDLPNVQVILDDASDLSSFEDDSVDAVLDKGLLDTIFCADEYDTIVEVMSSVHRVLKPGGVLCVLSFSRPEYLLPALEKVKLRRQGDALWSNMEVRECFNSIIMYRFEKMAQHVLKLKRGGGRRGVR